MLRHAMLLFVPFLLVALLPLRPAQAQAETTIVAVFDMEAKGSGLDAQVLNNLTDYLAVLLTESGYQVIPRDQIRARLKEQKAESHKECHDQSCQVEMGRELAAQKSLSTQVFKIGKQCRLTATFYDLRRAATDKAVRVKAPCTEEGLGEALETLAAKLTGKQVDAEKARKEKERKAKEEAARLAKAEADRKAKEKLKLAMKEQVDAEKARKEKERKAEEKAEADRKAAELAKKQEEAEDMQRMENYGTWAVKLRGGFNAPGVDPVIDSYGDGAAVDEFDGSTGPGACLGGEFAWRPFRYFALGYYLDFYSQGKSGERTEVGAGDFSLLTTGLRFWGIFPFGPVFDMRLGAGLGVGFVLNGDVVTSGMNVGIDGGPPGLSVDMELEAAWAVTDWLRLTLGFGVEGFLFSAYDYGEPAEEVDLNIAPIVFITVGTEFYF